MVELSLALLGPFQAVYGEQPLAHFRTRAVQALLIYLACSPEQSHSREALMTLLWPGLPTSSAQGNLRHALYHLRQAVPEVSGRSGESLPFLLADRQAIQVNPDGRFRLDVIEFEALSGPAATMEELQRAAALYRGDFLADFYLPGSAEFEAWVAARRADLRRRQLDVLRRLAADALRQGNHDDAENYARRQVQMDSLWEEGHRQLMQTMAGTGRRAAALAHYQELQALLQAELGITPSAETEALVAALRDESVPALTRHEKESPPPAAGPVRSSLPPQATPFVGRRAELAALDELLSVPGQRLVTVTGPGGIGKTRLALAAAERQLAARRHRDGVYFVPLAGLGAGERIVSAIADAVQVRLDRGEEQLLAYLRHKELLLLLDNFEELLDESALVGRLLQAIPGLQILVTSRERLRLKGEQVYPILGLPVGEESALDDAAQLFLQAAGRVRPDFQATAAAMPTINHICRLVEGMPLALELAAAWIELLTPEDIAGEIRRNLDFLETDLRDLPPRHRNMRAVFDASWRLLAPEEQALMARLSVFRGGFSREAAADVAGASLRDLATLANKSLLSFDPSASRYHLHELLRQYAAERLEEDGPLLDRYCTYYCAWTGAQTRRLQGPDQPAAVREIQAEMSNISAAIAHALGQERPPTADLNALIPGLVEFYLVYGQLDEGIMQLRQIANRLNQAPDLAPQALFWATLSLSNFLGITFQTEASAQLLQQARALLDHPAFRDRDTRAERAAILVQDGNNKFQWQPAAAVETFRRSCALLEELGDRSWEADALLGLGRAARNLGDLDQARAAVTRALSLQQALGDPLRQVEAELLMVNLDVFAGRYTRAETWLNERIQQMRQANHLQLLSLSLSYLNVVRFFSGRFEASLESLTELGQVGEAAGYTHLAGVWESTTRLHLGQTEGLAASVRAALSRAAARQAQDERLHYDAGLLLGMLAMLEGDIPLARDQFRHCRQLESVGGNWVAPFRCGVGLSLAAAIEGDHPAAHVMIVEELARAMEPPHEVKLAVVLAVMACLEALQGRPEQAVEWFALARRYPFIANSRWFAAVVGQRISAAASALPPETVTAAQARGERLDLWQTAASLL